MAHVPEMLSDCPENRLNWVHVSALVPPGPLVDHRSLDPYDPYELACSWKDLGATSCHLSSCLVVIGTQRPWRVLLKSFLHGVGHAVLRLASVDGMVAVASPWK